MKHLKNILTMLTTAIIFSLLALFALNKDLAKNGMHVSMPWFEFFSFIVVMLVWLIVFFYIAAMLKANQYISLAISGFLTPIAMILTTATLYWFNLHLLIMLPNSALTISSSAPDFSKFYQIIVAGIVVAGSNLLIRYAFTKIGEED
jgi:hypothetical protein